MALPECCQDFSRKVMLSSLNGIYAIDLKNNTLQYVNPEYTRLTGYTLDDLEKMGREGFAVLFHPEDRERLEAHTQALRQIADGQSLRLEYRFKTADGRWIWCVSRHTLLERDKQGQARWIIGTFLDITDHKSAEVALGRQRELLDHIIDTIPVMIVIHDTNMRHLRVNHEFRRVLGWSEADMVEGDALVKLFPDPFLRGKVRRYMANAQRGWRDFVLTAKDGSQVQSTWAVLRLSDRTHVSIGLDIRERMQTETVLTNARDRLESLVMMRNVQLEGMLKALETEIGERRKAEDQLRKWSRVFMDAADPIIIEDLSGTILDVNRETERVYGWSRAELVGRPVQCLIPADGHDQLATIRECCRAGREVRDWEGGRIDRAGRPFSVLVTAFPLVDESGAVTAVATIAKDITPRKRMEVELRASQKHLQALSRKSIEALESDRRTTAKEIHDSLGASLAAIKFSLEGIVEDMADKPAEAVAELERSIGHLVDTIKETKRISANLRPTTLDDLGLLPTLEWYFRQFRESYGRIRLTRSFEVCEDDFSDSLKIVIYRVLQEALSNAAKHSGADRVHVRLQVKNRELRLAVSDNGSGFDVQGALHRNDPMCGYGLKNMRERVEICGGRFRLSSRPGKGTRLELRVPQDVSCPLVGN
jgi:PAS domain S-box-containing protein